MRLSLASTLALPVAAMCLRDAKVNREGQKRRRFRKPKHIFVTSKSCEDTGFKESMLNDFNNSSMVLHCTCKMYRLARYRLEISHVEILHVEIPHVGRGRPRTEISIFQNIQQCRINFKQMAK